jgi:hypothetical protein
MKTMRIFAAVLAIAGGLLGLTSCGGYGKKLQFNGGELYYTPTVTEAEAKKLGEFLVKEGFFDGAKKTVQLRKTNGTYEFRMVAKKGTESDQNMLDLAKTFAGQLSQNVFSGAETVVHLCDDHLKTVRVVTAR